MRAASLQAARNVASSSQQLSPLASLARCSFQAAGVLGGKLL